MRTAFLAGALAALAPAGPAAAQEASTEGQIYAGIGTEPFWGVTFEDGKMIFTGDEERIEVVRPRPVTSRNGVHSYRTAQMTVEISHEGRCNDGMSDYEYPDTVRIRFGRSRTGRALEGCGGGILPPVTLSDTSWSITGIDGRRVGGDAYELRFDYDGIAGRAGCGRLTGPYTQRGRSLSPGRIEVTEESCGTERMEHQAKVLRLLGGPVEILYFGGTLMTLREANGSPGIAITLMRQ